MWFWPSRTVQCFYCNTSLELVPPQPASSNRKGKGRAVEGRGGAVAVGSRDDFWCGVCGQISRRDEKGDVVSDDAAFYDSSLNDESFAKRGSPSRTRLPSSFPTTQTTPFCRQCLNNQSLQLHLLASYPSSDDEQDPSDPFPPLDEYRRSLDARYPLVCADCAPNVEGVIRERDYRVKTQALGARLRESQLRREREERLSRQVRRRDGLRWTIEEWAWRARGAAWALTHGVTIAGCCCGLLRSDVAVPSHPLKHGVTTHSSTLLFVAIVSLLWSCWDPTWSTLRRERARGRQPLVIGRAPYIAVQLAAYVFRIGVLLKLRLFDNCPRVALLSLAFISIIALISAFYVPSLRHPPPIRLSSRSSGTATPTSTLSSRPADPLEPLAHLSLSRKGSLLAPSPPTTPTGARSPINGGSASTGSAASLRNRKSSEQTNGIRPRVPSFSLRPWRTTSAAAQAMEVDAAGSAATGEDADGANENTMDWTATPPPASIPFPSTSSRPASPFGAPTPTANGGNYVNFARQRFVPPDLRKPTGLEGMFERVAVKEEADGQVVQAGKDVEMKDAGGRSSWLGGWLGR
ncbi:Ima1_N domain-containing protein [Rhodotorula toruloides]|uniref:Ima1 N-terminal domain-containing protein n=1 Tax=Rhodotorula toruloides TaxID=5286 RepID=A0A0K3CEF5_RHOTO|nr:Ima1_N domain-containing protein [Rhodotorula toruloides]